MFKCASLQRNTTISPEFGETNSHTTDQFEECGVFCGQFPIKEAALKGKTIKWGVHLA